MKKGIDFKKIKEGYAYLYQKMFSKQSQVFFFLFLWVGGYIFFLSSKFWMAEDLGKLKFTPFYETQSVNGRRTRLMDATLDTEQGLVMVELEIENYQLLEHAVDHLEIKDANFRRVPYRVIYMDEGYLIFVVPAGKNFTSIYVRGFFLNEKEDLSQVFQIFVSKNKNLREASIQLDRSEAKIYEDKEKLEIGYIQDFISKKESEIKDKEKEHETLVGLIAEFKKKEDSLTESEKKVFRVELSKNESQSEEILKDISALKKEKLDYEERLEKIEKRSSKE